ncbi:hypothetical protein Leryth_023058 [Lithospermum erythrorhizon]|nr:hypothetical protein Leryth_023058 [Lithospermum erythrorhizon]
MRSFSLSNLIFLVANLLICGWSFDEESMELPNTPIDKITLNRNSFPRDFLFGSASAAYQYEGAVHEDGRGPSIWDEFSHKYPDKVKDGSNGDITEDFYNHYKDDIKLMKSFGLNSFRLSISWSRVLPYGKLSKGVNKKGIEFYNNLINELLSNGIKPFVTIFHWDTPQTLQDEYGGFLSPNIVNDYRDFAELCFKEFGDRVQNWITFNEPYMYSLMAYEGGVFIGNEATEPYLVAHHILLSHAKVVQLYRNNHQVSQNGQIGITLICHWMLPYSNSTADSLASQRALDFMFGWFMDPLTYGRYPKNMRNIVGSRLPIFTTEEATLVKGSFDFLGINYYTGNYVSNVPIPSNGLSAATDPQVIQTFEQNGKSIGQPTGGSEFYVYPKGLHDLLVYTKETYNNPTIYITENGMPDSNNLTSSQLMRDTQRVDFLGRHLLALKQAIGDGVNVKGYFVWSFLDTWEWTSGYTMRFGLTYIDYKNGLKRIPKLSALWLKNFLKQDETNNLVQYY